VQLLENFPAFYGTRRFITTVYISSPPVPILGQIDPIHTIPSYLSKIHFNIVHPSTSWSSQWPMDLREIGKGGIDWIDLAQDKDQWRALVNTVMNLQVP
jgi:hypothetical protein